MITTVHVFMLNVNPQRDIPPAAGSEMVLHTSQVTGHQCKQVTGLCEGVAPAHPVPAVVQVTGIHCVTIRQKDRVALFIGHDGDVITGHDVGPVREIGDFSETLGLTLGEEKVAGGIESLEGCILVWPDLDFDVQLTLLRGIMYD